MSVSTILRSFLSIHAKNNIGFKVACTYYQQNFFSAKAPQQSIVKEIDPSTGEIRKKKTTVIPKITLLSGDSISVTTLEEAQNLSKRRDLKLVKIIDVDTKTQRPVYKLMTGAEYHAEDLKQREQRKKDKQRSSIKGEKVLLLNSRISAHDLQTQLKKVVKWINKMYEVRVVINTSSSNKESGEKIFTSFEEHFKDAGSEARFVQKREKGSDIKFQIIPPKKKNEDDNL